MTRALLPVALVVAALALSAGVHALLGDAREAARWLLGIGVLASAVAGVTGWRAMRGRDP